MTYMTALFCALFLVIGIGLGLVIGNLVARNRFTAQLVEAQTARTMLGERTHDLEADAALATELTAAVGPLSSGLRTLQADVGRHERDRIEQISRLSEQITSLSDQNRLLQQSTAALSGALNSTSQRGTWGEVQLRRIVEHAGLLTHVDFDEQARITSSEGRALRPDLVVHLPGEGTIVIDAKAPLSARLGEGDPKEHVRAMLRHIDALASRAYWQSFDSSPEFVVCFIPADGLLSEAVRTYPQLVDQAMAKNVVLASPSTLLVLLKTVALNWRQHDISTSAKDVLRLGRELYERTGLLADRLSRLGSSLDRAVADYNGFVGSFESRFLVTARRLTQTGIVTDELAPATELSTARRDAVARELRVD